MLPLASCQNVAVKSVYQAQILACLLKLEQLEPGRL